MFGKRKLTEGPPSDIPAFVGKYIVTEMQKLPQTSDHWVDYKAVVRPQAGKADTFDIRIVDMWEVKAKGITVPNYASLDSNPDMIKFEGWYNAKSHLVEIKARMPAEQAQPKATAK
jgi:hypothetical protein